MYNHWTGPDPFSLFCSSVITSLIFYQINTGLIFLILLQLSLRMNYTDKQELWWFFHPAWPISIYLCICSLSKLHVVICHSIFGYRIYSRTVRDKTLKKLNFLTVIFFSIFILYPAIFLCLF